LVRSAAGGEFLNALNIHWGDLLLIEDNPGDVTLIQHALHKTRIHTRVHHVSDGEQAMKYLKSAPGDDSHARPHLILLDLNLPRRDGRQILDDIKADESLKDIFVFILTSSELEEDLYKTVFAKASGCFTKPSSFAEYEMIFKKIESVIEEKRILENEI